MMYGLLGEKLGHSFSKEIHEGFGEYSYALFEKPKEQVTREFLNTFNGLNVTIPYKEVVIPLLDVVDEDAKDIGAVNTIVNVGGKLYGYNTDILGMQYMLDTAGITLANKCVAILGSGGTSKTARRLCKNQGASKIIIVSRSGEVNYENIEENQDIQVIINTTPIGMYPNNDNSPIDISKFGNLESVVDAIYNPLMTKLCFDAKKCGLKYCNGLMMLVAQAKFARDFFLSNVASNDLIEKSYKELLCSRQSIMLIGMAGTGKSTIAKMLGEKCKKDVVDLDEEIVKREKMTIPEIFSLHGEEYFRQIESQVLQEQCKIGGKIIATGGGIVVKYRNWFNLKQNAKVVLILRDVEKLDRSGRPLSTDEQRVKALFEERREKYFALADIVVDNNGDIQSAVQKILGEI